MSTAIKPKLGAPEIVGELEGFSELADEPLDLESRKFRRHHRVADRVDRMRAIEAAEHDAHAKKAEARRAKQEADQRRKEEQESQRLERAEAREKIARRQ